MLVASTSVNAPDVAFTAETAPGPTWTMAPSSFAARAPPVATSAYAAAIGAGADSGPAVVTVTCVSESSSVSPSKTSTAPSIVTRAPTLAAVRVAEPAPV